MAKQCFQLKRSRFALLFQLLVLGFVFYILSVTLSMWLVFLAMTIAIVAYVIFLRRDQVIQLDYLDAQDWTLTNHQNKLWRDQIKKIIDHELYIVIYFNQHQPLVIWCDQLKWQDWKRLKVLAQLY